MEGNNPDVLGPVDYLVVEFPADKANFSGEMAAELTALVDRGLVRVLDLLLLRKDLDGSVAVDELHEVDASNLGQLRALEADLALLLAAEDVDEIGKVLEPAMSRRCWSTRTAGPGHLHRRSDGRVANWSPTAASRPRHCWPPSKRKRKPTRQELDMPLGRGRVGRQGVLGGRPVARAGAVVGTAAVVKHGHGRREDRRDDRGDQREDRREDRGPGVFR